MAVNDFGFPNTAGRPSVGYKFRNSEFSSGPLFEFLLCVASFQLWYDQIKLDMYFGSDFFFFLLYS